MCSGSRDGGIARLISKCHVEVGKGRPLQQGARALPEEKN